MEAVCIPLSGSVTFETIESYLTQLDQHAWTQPVQLDCKGLTESDSTIIALLLAWKRQGQQINQAVQIKAVPETVQSLMGLYGVKEILLDQK